MYAHAAPPSVAISECFGTNSVTATLEWIQESGVTYNISIFPQVPVEMLRISSVQLTLLYNTDYNATVVAILCRQNNVTTTIPLRYGEILSMHVTYNTIIMNTNVQSTVVIHLVK